MKESFYFPHDYNAISDPKMTLLLLEGGLSAVAIYWIIIELLHQQPSWKISIQAFEWCIRFYSHFEAENQQLLNKIQHALITSQLLLKEGDFIFSQRVLENKKNRENISKARSEAWKKSAERRANSTIVEQNSTRVQQNSTKERKRKEINIASKDAIEKKFFESEKINSSFLEFIENRKQMKKEMTDLALQKVVKKITWWIEKYKEDEVLFFINSAIENNWQWLFEVFPKIGSNPSFNSKPKTILATQSNRNDTTF